MTTLKEAAAEKLGKTVTVMGIAIEGVTSDAFNDFEVMEAFAVMTDPDATEAETMRAMASFGPIIFGSKQWKRIKAELREQNGGRLPVEAAMGFINDAMTEMKAKNF